MSQTNTNVNNGQNRNQIYRRSERGLEAPNVNGSGNRRNVCGHNFIEKYTFDGKMKDGPLSKLTIAKPGHRPSQFKKICDALPIFCDDKNYQDLDEVLRTGYNKVKADFMPAYPDTTW